MSDTYNIANLKLDTEYPGPQTYFISSIYYQENPYNNIPDGCSLIEWDDVTFSVLLGPKYYWRNVENAVVDGNGIPLYLIGDFFGK